MGFGTISKGIRKASHYFPLLASIGPGRDPAVGPQEVMVDFNNSCNLHCLCCYNYSPLSPCRFEEEERLRHFDPDLFVRLLDDCASLGAVNINLAGYGEPLMHPQAGKLLREIGGRGLKASIVTNGTLLTRFTVVSELLSGATVSIQAGSEEIYRRMHPRDSEKNWRRVQEGLDLLHRAGIPITIAFVLCSENYRDVGAAVELAGRYGANLDIQPIRPFIRREEGKPDFDPAQETRLRLTESQLKELLENRKAINRLAAARKVSIYGLDDFLDLSASALSGDPEARIGDPAREFYTRFPCYTGWYFSRVLMDGTVTPCCQCVGRISLGNINHSSFADIWRSDAYRRFREQTLRVPLLDTEIWNLCQCHLCDSIMRNRLVHQHLRGQGKVGRLFRLLKPWLRRKR
ncbi:MAG: radical SAM protein [Candidatus Krumholzibacteriota bacterium]|nr:radical SAM protein [Candidatus Krumholzibacteriota bacterium]